jgi:hypothetical protein
LEWIYGRRKSVRDLKGKTTGNSGDHDPAEEQEKKGKGGGRRERGRGKGDKHPKEEEAK